MSDAKAGAWVTYSWSDGVTVDSIYDTEIDALRAAVSSGYLKVVFLGYGESLHEVAS